jgi:hypothetical protein
MAEDDSAQRRGRYQRAIAGGLAALGGSLVAGPAGAIAIAVLGPLLEPFARLIWEELSASGQRRMGEALASACDAGIPLDELADRINASDRTQLLAGYALAAASRTAWEDKVRTLGRSLASGLLAADEAQIDTEQLIISAIADIEAPHLALLEFLVCWEPGRDVSRPPIDGPLDIPAYSHGLPSTGGWIVQNRAWATWQIREQRPRLAPVAPSLLGTLQRHGLAVQNDNTPQAIERYQQQLEEADARQHPGLTFGPAVPRVTDAGRMVPEPTWSPTELGEQVYLRFRDAGTNLPDVWTTGNTGQEK